MKEHGVNNYNLLFEKIKNIDKLSINKVLKKLKKKVVCVGSGSSKTTAYLAAKILRMCFNRDSYFMSPRELLNDVIDDASILIFSYSGTSKDTLFLRKKYPNSILITGRSLKEFDNKKNIFSYYLSADYERGLILYENVIIPIFLLIKEIAELKSIIRYEISNFGKYDINIDEVRKIAVFGGDYTVSAVMDFFDKILETGIVRCDVYDKKDFSHGQYNYYNHNKYDLVIYFRQKEVSDYELQLIKKLKNVLVVNSEFNGLKAEIDLIFKSFIMFNSILEKKQLKLYDNKYNELYSFEGDFK